MRIQNINMAVPVASGTPDDSDEALREEIAVEEAQLNHLIVACLEAVKRRHRWVWSGKARAANEEQFKRELKGIVKRWVSTSTEMVNDRDTRGRLRVRQYSELVALALNMSADTDERAARRHRWLGSVFIVLTVGVFACGGALILLLNG